MHYVNFLNFDANNQMKIDQNISKKINIIHSATTTYSYLRKNQNNKKNILVQQKLLSETHRPSNMFSPKKKYEKHVAVPKISKAWTLIMIKNITYAAKNI